MYSCYNTMVVYRPSVNHPFQKVKNCVNMNAEYINYNNNQVALPCPNYACFRIITAVYDVRSHTNGPKQFNINYISF